MRLDGGQFLLGAFFLDEQAQGGGPLIDIGTHALDLTLWMMDNYKPKYVVGNAYHKLSETKKMPPMLGVLGIQMNLM